MCGIPHSSLTTVTLSALDSQAETSSAVNEVVWLEQETRMNENRKRTFFIFRQHLDEDSEYTIPTELESDICFAEWTDSFETSHELRRDPLLT